MTLPAIEVAPRSGTCPRCDHQTSPSNGRTVWQWLFRRPMPPASCSVDVEDVDGVGSQPCFCRDPWHGS